jgi:sulfite exporter TauE/SafE
MIALVAAVLGASLVGSVHCAGMCGGFVGFYAGGGRGGRRSAVVHAAYSAGRLAAYAALGAMAGAVGAALDATGGVLLGAQRAAGVVSGVLIVLWGVVILLQALGVRVPPLVAPAGMGAAVRAGVARVAGAPPATRAFAIGLLTGCLPCGWLYAFVVTAAGTGSALAGAGLMAVFWAGTLPVMVSLGLGLGALAGPLRRHVPAACAIAMIAVGLFAVGGRLRAAAPGNHAVTAPAAVAEPAAHHHAHR